MPGDFEGLALRQASTDRRFCSGRKVFGNLGETSLLSTNRANEALPKMRATHEGDIGVVRKCGGLSANYAGRNEVFLRI